MAQSLNPSADPDQVRFNQKLVDKLKYCKEVLVSIKEASAGVAAKQGQEQQVPVPAAARADRPSQKRSTGASEAATLGNGHTYAPNMRQEGLVARASRMTLR
jgi:hypothetical protein